MGQFYETCSTFNYTWEQVAKAFWNRYPNPFSAHVISEDTLCREVREGQLYSRRLITKTNRVPRWAQRLMESGSRKTNVTIVEESYVDPERKTITTYTRNVGYNRIMNVVEKVEYKPDPENPQLTIAHRFAWIDSRLYGFRMAIERYGIARFRKASAQAVQGFNWILNRIYCNSTGPAPGPGGFRLGEAKEKMMEKARKAGDVAKSKISSLYAASAAGPTKDP